MQSRQKKAPSLQSEDEGGVSNTLSSAMFNVYSDNKAEDEELGDNSQVKDYLRGCL